RSVAERLISSGREVLSLSRTSEGASGDSVTCDVSDYEAVKTVAQSLRKEKREIEGLVNAAGIASMNLAVTTPPSMTQKLIQTNLAGTIHCCQLFAPLMIRKKAGSIINFSTIAVTLGLKGESIYAASKAGVEGFSRAFAREMADFDIRVNCIAPGPIKTDLLKGVSDEQIDAIVAQQILPKLFLPDDVADLCEFLLGPQSQSLSGQVLKVGGA
ncbi:MAG: SDR family oxidoreductase, partial [Verrucomicrobiota bacterium]|nr:SDR family oxidoreductase [Verrucomicrobiota bacterium]